jgi:anthranilate synthase component 2
MTLYLNDLMKILLLDNFDSFTYNLFHRLEPFCSQIEVIRNDKLDLNYASSFDAVVLSPGPGLPSDAGCMPELIKKYHTQLPILGICLGMQAIGEHFGARLHNLNTVLHGIPQTGVITAPDDPIYTGITSPIDTGHYHSWVVKDLPEKLIPTAVHRDGWPLSIKHAGYPVYGIQYHPESVLTPCGAQILENWINSIRPPR